MSLPLPTILCSLFFLSLSLAIYFSWTTTMVAGNHAQRMFSYLLWPAQNEDDPQQYKNDSVAWLTICPSDTLYVLLSGPSKTYRLSFVFNPAERVSHACPSSCQAGVHTSSLSLGYQRTWQLAPGQTTNVLTYLRYLPLFNMTTTWVFSPPLKFSWQIECHTWTKIHGQNLPLISRPSTQKQIF